MALNAFITVDRTSRGEGCRSGLNWIFTPLGFFWDFPLPVLKNAECNGDANYDEEASEEEFTQAECALRVGGHR